MATNTAAIEEPLGYAIIIYEDAKKDIIEIAKWDDLQMDGLGNRFEKCLGDAVQKLMTHPLAFGLLFKDVRKITLNTFP